MTERIDSMKKRGDSLGGGFEIIATKVPVGLGSHIQYDRKLDGKLSGALMSIQGVKAVEIGSGIEGSRWMGSRFHDGIFYKKGAGFYRKTNNAGGIEGGISNGQPIIIKGYMKPISTLSAPLSSVDIKTKKPYKATVERHDVCAVPACGVVAESVVAFELACAMQEKFGGDSLQEMKRNYKEYIKTLR
jgi:chorismate synthase